MSAPSWLASLLEDPQVTDICVNGEAGAFYDRGRGMERAEGRWPLEEQRSWVLAMLSLNGKTWDARHPFSDATVPSGHRLHAAFPPIAREGILISLRRLSRPESSTEVSERRWSGSPLFGRLREIVRQGESLLVSGATGSGKTTLAADLLRLVPESERILALEDVPELAPGHPHFVSLLSRPPNSDGFGEVSLRTLLRQALRMRPDRIVLGECRGAEVLDLLQALNTGHRGALATLHANSPRDAIRRVELLCLLAAGGSLTSSVARELIACGVQWIAQTQRVGSERRITELWRVEGREGDTILMRRMLD